MRWFKHFTDMHEGRTVGNLMDEMGHMGLCFFLLQELCAKKLDRPEGEEETLTEADCLFIFLERNVRQRLRISPTNLRRLLDICQTNGQLSYHFSGKNLEIKMPILLDLLDRRTKKASVRRRDDVRKVSLDIDKEEDKDKEKNKGEEFEFIFSLYPNKVGKAEGFRRLVAQDLSPKDLEDLTIAISNYVRFLGLEKNKGWMQAKQFDVFAGAPTKPNKPWREWVDPDPSIFEDHAPNSHKANNTFDPMTAPLRGA